MAIACLFSCKHETKKSNPETAAVAKPNTQANADTVESYTVNASGDSVPYYHWAAQMRTGIGKHGIRRSG